MVKVNKERCVGCGLCVSICPEAFEIKNGKASVKAKGKNSNCIKDAINQCPVKAISE